MDSNIPKQSITLISKLPAEILAGIFEAGHACQDDTGGIESVLAVVCKDWLAVVLRTPRLWTRIECPADRKHHRQISLYLQKSRRKPLDLLIDVDEEDSHDLESLCRLLGAHFWRIWRLRVSCPEQTLIQPLLHQLHSITAPFLHSIDIDCWAYKQLDNLSGPVDVFAGGAPALTEIHLNNISVVLCRLPLTHVKAMQLRQDLCRQETISSEEWVTTMAAATSLVHLEVDGGTVLADWEDSTIPMDMPSLRSMVIVVCRVWINPGMLARIKATGLEVLMVKNYVYHQDAFPVPRRNHFPSLHTSISWNLKIAGEKGEWHLLLDEMLPCSQHFVWGDIREENCKRLLSALSRYDDEDPSEHGEEDADVEEDDLKGWDGGDGHGHGGADGEEEQTHGVCRNSDVAERVGHEEKKDPGAGPKRAAYLPNLRTIAIIPATYPHPYPIPLAELRAFLAKRKATAQSIEKIYVPAESVAEVSKEFPSEEGLVQVEAWLPQLLPNGDMWSDDCWDLCVDDA
ncbi:hypothetical protein FIBSPDRAFT_1039428 [Athelia psychrophila]|uniref:Uncharacterized protein n=1 Tax=Athelia psychrophila TaxID=1759441 RepID=A0A166RV08_9AGAM|nr:hypothetical protein FIBSPDRAFT_1039428 [Fibularhizoctonia sp. CBS 109695]